MSWKTIKEHYRIDHIVQAGENCILIGSPYISNILTIQPDGSVKWGQKWEHSNDKLARYYREMTADPAKLAELYAATDTFTASLPVYTYEGGEIIEKQCEAYDWPNVTHDGQLMYENTFSADKAQVIAWAIHNAELGIQSHQRNLTDAEHRLQEIRKNLATEKANLAKLKANHLTIT
jgi:hypothetical protein